MEMRRSMQDAMDATAARFDAIEAEFETLFGRRYGAVEAVGCDDAEVVFVVSGSVVGTCRHTLQELRAAGVPVGMIKVKMFRPFPAEALCALLPQKAAVAVIDRNCSIGAGGVFAQEVRAAAYHRHGHPRIFSYVAGLGGRDITPDTLHAVYEKTKASAQPPTESIWVGLHRHDH
jgi:pyruvate/2-oxoacid:ferredoxin oxidoreductase alpha subunit